MHFLLFIWYYWYIILVWQIISQVFSSKWTFPSFVNIFIHLMILVLAHLSKWNRGYTWHHEYFFQHFQKQCRYYKMEDLECAHFFYCHQTKPIIIYIIFHFFKLFAILWNHHCWWWINVYVLYGLPLSTNLCRHERLTK